MPLEEPDQRLIASMRPGHFYPGDYDSVFYLVETESLLQ